MTRYEEHVDELADPEKVDAAAFKADNKVSQELCDFVLALAVVYNDLRDLLLAWVLLGDIFPEKKEPTARRGQAAGLATHLFRALTGLIHELLVLIESNAAARRDPEFAEVVRKVHPKARKAWQAIVTIPKGSKSADPLGRFVYWARNQVAFHYDAPAIARGYELAFANPDVNVPQFSRGRNMAAARFYFADAAVDTYMRSSSNADAPTVKQLLKGEAEVVGQINHALREIVTEFIRRRRATLARGRRTALPLVEDHLGELQNPKIV
jgi:hypothetical protein